MSNSPHSLYGAVEAGGTKFVCALGEPGGRLVAEASFATTTPDETLARVADFFVEARVRHGAVAAVGIGSFGPVHVRRGAPQYGRIARTPKPGWEGVDILGEISRGACAPAAIDTDVNVALLGEARHGAGAGCDDVVYVTVGTGIGAGLMANGRIVYGFAHPEVGHMHVPKLAEDAAFAGVCAFHGDRCIEGLASGPALRERWGTGAENLPPEHHGWTLQARYLAALCVNLLVTCAPRRIILGGGVMMQAHLFARVRMSLCELLNGYLDFAAYGIGLDELVVPARLGGRAGVVGALELARDFATAG
ncbi:MAG: ROK family protein [Rudaea sp.]|uniref:ROK family protein n=1 Tax=Rudaea sp. TaxID=2136325 RepID=UPI0039E37392